MFRVYNIPYSKSIFTFPQTILDFALTSQIYITKSTIHSAYDQNIIQQSLLTLPENATNHKENHERRGHQMECFKIIY